VTGHLLGACLGLSTPVIVTPRLELVSLAPAFLRASLAGQTAEAAALIQASLPPAWPSGHERLLRRRLAQLEANPADQPWLLRAILRRAAQVRPLVGLVGFHAAPDPTGTLEIGYRVEPAARRHGYATEAVQALFAWAAASPAVERFRASIQPDNAPSLKLIDRFGFTRTGQRWDDEDQVVELVFERHARTPRPYTSDENTT
jgi:RimJ/RimL family protein N-acetyltransferase